MNQPVKNKQVDIRIPGASLKISNESEDSDFGMKIYPDARLRPDTENDRNTNNVNFQVASSLFGFALVVQKYDSSDSPAEIASFYEDELSQYGPVIKSTAPSQVGEDEEEYHTELKTGEEHNQRIVAIKPHSAGSSFALVHVRLRGSC